MLKIHIPNIDPFYAQSALTLSQGLKDVLDKFAKNGSIFSNHVLSDSSFFTDNYLLVVADHYLQGLSALVAVDFGIVDD